MELSVSNQQMVLRRDVPISKHHMPVPQPMSNMRFGRLSGANQFLLRKRALIMTCCMFNRSFSCWTRLVSHVRIGAHRDKEGQAYRVIWERICYVDVSTWS
jgi:hypothetical protein